MDAAVRARGKALIGVANHVSRLTAFYVRKGWWSKILLAVILVALLVGVSQEPLSVQAKPKAAQDLFVSGYDSSNVVRFDGVTGSPVNGGVFASGNGLNGGEGIAYGPDGNLYVASGNSSQILRFNGTTGAFLNVFVNNSGGQISFPHDIHFHGNYLYVASYSNSRIVRYDATSGAFVDIFAANGVGSPLLNPTGMDFDSGGNLYVSCAGNNSVARITPTGTVTTFVASGSGGLSNPNDLIFGPNGNLYVSSSNTNQILGYNGTSGNSIGIFIPDTAGLLGPNGLLYGPDGNLYVASQANSRVYRFNPTTGQPIGTGIFASGGGLQESKFLAFNPAAACTATTTTITSHTPNPVTLGQTITVGFAVTSAGGTPTTGTVLVSDGTASCTGNVGTGGTGSCVLTPTSAGAKTLVATYTDNGVNWCSSASAGVSHTVQAPSCTTSMTSSANPSTPGQAVTFLATVTSSTCTVTGNVIFRDGATTLCTSALNGSGQATCTTSSLSVGSHNITAVWNGSQTCITTCTSTTLAQVVGATAQAPTTPSEVPEADTLLLFAGGGSAFATWLGWQWRKVRRKIKS